MSSKLIKVEGIGYQTLGGNDYYLILDKKIYHTNPLTSGLSGGGKLSVKNCESIENGYDLDELVEERFGETFWHDGDKYFKEGFQKALEILGDKNKKNIELLKEKLTDYFEDITDQKSYISEKIDDILQQTEWDVIVDVLLTERHGGVVYETPKLDADGCLILKRKV